MQQLDFSLTPPEPLQAIHRSADFDCGIPELNTWLQQRARLNQASGASRTFVIHRSHEIIGFYSLSSGALAVQSAPGRLRRNMPEPIPVIILGRLAVSQSYQGYGLGRALLKDALLRTVQAGHLIGIRALLVHALNTEAKAFYESLGFLPFPEEELTLYILLKDITH
jgi:GNAT superfamily N-acetyltransferase